MHEAETELAAKRRPDQRLAMRGLLILDVVVRLFIWTKAIALTCWVFTLLNAWPGGPLVGAGFRTAWLWGQRLSAWVLLFNIIYVIEIIVLRAFIPTPREGRHPLGPGVRISRQMIWASLIGTLIKARLEAPFPGFLVFHLANLPPLHWFMAHVFGPKSKSCNFTDPVMLDPHFVTIGRNVIIGLDAIIAGHHQDRDSITFRRVVIEDDVVIGGRSVIMAGSHLKRGCMIGVSAVVLPDSVVGPNEFWAGVPARRVRTVKVSGQDASAAASVGHDSAVGADKPGPDAKSVERGGGT